MALVKSSSDDDDDDVLQERNALAQSSWRIPTANNRFVLFHEEKERNYQGPFYFVQGADTQFGFIQGYLEKNPVPGWSKEIALAELAVRRINAMRPKPRFFVMCGDLCDAFPADQPELRRAQEADFKHVLGQLDPDIPLVCVCGNHDVGNRPTRETIEAYRSSFGDDYFSFWCGGVLFLVINSQYYHDASLVPDLARRQGDWLDATLEVARGSGAMAIVFQHIPWFVADAEETDSGYFAVEPVARKLALEKFRAAGVRCVFAGHYHRNAGGWCGDLEMVVTSAVGGQLGLDRSGMRLVRCTERRVTHAYYALEDFPRTVDIDES